MEVRETEGKRVAGKRERGGGGREKETGEKGGLNISKVGRDKKLASRRRGRERRKIWIGE